MPAPLAPFLEAGELLYAGPWVAERLLEFGDFLARHPDAVLPVIAEHHLAAAPGSAPSTRSAPSTGWPS